MLWALPTPHALGTVGLAQELSRSFGTRNHKDCHFQVSLSKPRCKPYKHPKWRFFVSLDDYKTRGVGFLLEGFVVGLLTKGRGFLQFIELLVNYVRVQSNTRLPWLHQYNKPQLIL